MSAPDNSPPKGAPSLMGGAGADAQAAKREGGRILADLEGRVSSPPPVASAASSGRPRKMFWGAGGLILVALASFGAWRTFGADSSAPQSKSANAPLVAAKPAAAPALLAQASVPSVASAPRPATIVNEEASAPVAQVAAIPPRADDGRLSRALISGTAGASAAAAEQPHLSPRAERAREREAHRIQQQQLADQRRQQVRDRRQASEQLAQERKQKSVKASGSAGTKSDDPDADLLAALVARTRPGTPIDRSGLSRADAVPAGDPSITAQLKACGKKNFLDEQICRWHVCDGHWGKDPSCPAAQRVDRG